MNALIIENSRLYRQLLDNILGQQGFVTDITDELSVARDHLQHNQYDIIFINENLKDGSGLELIRYCKQHQELKQVPILLFTSDDNIQDKFELDIDGIIYKHNLQQISDQITNFLETHLDPVFCEGRILFIEDSDSLAQMILSTLSQTGYRVEHYKSADAAWKEFNDEISYGSDYQAYDLVISDVNVEGELNGLQLTQLIRKLEDARGFIPIIAITAQTEAEIRLSLYQEGVSDFIPKPILIDELLVRVNNLITNKRLLDKVHDQRRELFTLATTDKLTGCHNRHSLMDFSQKFISQAIRHHFPVSVLVIDLDHFKNINDTHGHATGDIVLQATGQLLTNNFRDGDMVARFGGEEFVVLLNHCAQEDAAVIAEKFRQRLEALKPADLKVTASIGIACLDIGKQYDFEALFAAADKGVYAAKENGRNQVQLINIE